MSKVQQEKLLRKFYNGETTAEEEIRLKQEIGNSDECSPEKDYFGYTAAQGAIPHSLEQDITLFLDKNIREKKLTMRRILSLVSVAASLLIIFSITHWIKETKSRKMEDNFFLMEQALFQVSETLKPEIQEDMVVLWVDNNVEIIIN